MTRTAIIAAANRLVVEWAQKKRRARKRVFVSVSWPEFEWKILENTILRGRERSVRGEDELTTEPNDALRRLMSHTPPWEHA